MLFSLTHSSVSSYASASKAIDILEAYEGTLEDDYPPDNERCEHGEMLLYKVIFEVASTIKAITHRSGLIHELI